MSSRTSLDRAMKNAALALRREHGSAPILATTVAVFVVFALLAPQTFPTPANMISIGFSLPGIALLAMGVMLSMVLAGIDLSVVAIADLAGVTMVQYFQAVGSGHWGPLVIAGGIVIALAVGAGCGAINGWLIGRLRITPILATLATMELFGGLAIAWTGGHALFGVPKTILHAANLNLGGIPLPAIILVVCALLVALLLHGSRFGIRSILVGANPRAAKLSGIRETRVQLGIYAVSGILAAVAGIIFVGRMAGAIPDYGGSSYILLAVVIAVLAGVNPGGGFGTVMGVMLAAFVLSMIKSGFIALDLGQFVYEIAQGAILIIVLTFGAIARGDIRWLSWLRRWRTRNKDREVHAGSSTSDG